MSESFWSHLKKPIIGLSPMDGVTDAAFRFIVDKYGKPDILVTEFTSVEGIAHGAVRLLDAFIHHDTCTPTLGQLFGSNPDDFYKSAFVIAEMGYDGIDVNMGCPDARVAQKGGGAALILRPKIAQAIIRMVKQAVTDWADGKEISTVGLPPDIVDFVKHYRDENKIKPSRVILPVSVKTRIGYDKTVTEDWISQLLSAQPAAISLHGRTLKQMYTGKADWEEIGKASKLVKKTKTLILGNGDVKTVVEAKEKALQYGLDGVLIGRAAFGDPWIFSEHVASEKERKQVALEQCEVFMKLSPDLHFLNLRKHLAWYMKGFNGSHELRQKLMKVTTLDDVKNVLYS